jgi:hypothetical protein
MRARTYLVLALLGCGVSLAVAHFQSFPGYLDSDYYFGGGLQLAAGKGFTEPYIWNYLDDPQTLPHPSHTYWMPLASIVTASSLWVTGQSSYSAGRIGFIVLASLVPVVTAALAYSFSRRSDLAAISGLLAVFSGYYAPFLPVTDNYAPYMVFGGLFFLVLGSSRRFAPLGLGILAGLMTLARSDGMLWLGVTILVVLWRHYRQIAVEPGQGGRPPKTALVSAVLMGSASLQVVLAGAGFLLVTGAWFWRTEALYGSLLAPGGARLLWLNNYNETFLYPGNQLTIGHWLEQGWIAIVEARLAALKWNLLNAFAAQGDLVLAPFILVGLWTNRRDQRVGAGCLAWLTLLFVMTAVFPFAGGRGGFFHSGAALQALWWAVAPLGLETAITAARERNLFTPHAFVVFRTALVGVAILLTAAIVALRVLRGWGEGEQYYPAQAAFLRQSGIRPGEVVMVRNPPGFFIMTGQPAIVVPYGDSSSILAAASRYGADYLVIEAAGAVGPIKTVYDDARSTTFEFLGEVNGARIFQISH